MLEVLEIRALRREPLQVVVTAHIIGEYLLQLAWETTLGHGGDPMLMERFVGGSRWGTDDPACPHSSALRSDREALAQRVQRRPGRLHRLSRPLPLPARGGARGVRA